MQKQKQDSLKSTQTTTISRQSSEEDLSTRLDNIQRITQNDDFTNREIMSTHHGHDEHIVRETPITINRPASPPVNPPVDRNYGQTIYQINRERQQANSMNNNYHPIRNQQVAPEIEESAIPRSADNVRIFTQQNADIHQRATERVNFYQDQIDVYTEIGNTFRQLRLQASHVTHSLITWSWHHPVLAFSTLSTMAGVIWYLFKARTALRLIANLATNTNPATTGLGIVGLIENVMPSNNNQQNRVTQQQNSTSNWILLLSQFGGLSYILSIFRRF